MIAIDNKHYRFGIILQCCQKFTKEIIGFFQLADVVFKSILQIFILFKPGAGDVIRRFGLFGRVLPVALYCDSAVTISALSYKHEI